VGQDPRDVSSLLSCGSAERFKIPKGRRKAKIRSLAQGARTDLGRAIGATVVSANLVLVAECQSGPAAHRSVLLWGAPSRATQKRGPPRNSGKRGKIVEGEAHSWRNNDRGREEAGPPFIRGPMGGVLLLRANKTTVLECPAQHSRNRRVFRVDRADALPPAPAGFFTGGRGGPRPSHPEWRGGNTKLRLVPVRTAGAPRWVAQTRETGQMSPFCGLVGAEHKEVRRARRAKGRGRRHAIDAAARHVRLVEKMTRSHGVWVQGSLRARASCA